MSKKFELSDIADVRAGYAFRGKIYDVSEGSVNVIQMKNINDLKQVDWSALMKTELKGKKPPKWLKKSDILFLARGNSNYAIYLDRVKEHTLCSPHFFQVHVKDNNVILPSFLVWQINQAPVQSYLAKVMEGAVVGNIRKGVVESIPIVIPSIEKQLLIIELNNIARQQHELLLQKIENNRLTMTGIAEQLTNDN